jgi:pre-60S factor REI1
MASVAAADGAGAPESHQFTCNSCQVAYRTDTMQREHMKSDWHRYNLKRRVVSLPPITAEVFADKVLQARAATTAEAERATYSRLCDVCQKTYYSENSFRNHLSGQRHRAKRAETARRPAAAAETAVETAAETGSVVTSTFSMGEPLESAGGDSDGEAGEGEGEAGATKADDVAKVAEVLQKTTLADVPEESKAEEDSKGAAEEDSKDTAGAAQSTKPTASNDAAAAPDTKEVPPHLKECLFCNRASATVDLNIRHMEQRHGMFIPERTYLVDLAGLLTQLRSRIQDDNECFVCGKVKANGYAVQTHMRDAAHCRIPFSTLEEQLEIGDFYDFRETYSDGGEDEEWEDEDGEGEGEDEEMGDDAASDAASDSDDGKHHKAEPAVYYDEFELHLPSGIAVGHRSLNKYYRQNLHSHPLPEERLASKPPTDADAAEADDATIRRAKARGRTVPRSALGMEGVTERQREVARKNEVRGRALENHHQKQREWQVNKALNNHKSYYYRYEGGG